VRILLLHEFSRSTRENVQLSLTRKISKRKRRKLAIRENSLLFDFERVRERERERESTLEQQRAGGEKMTAIAATGLRSTQFVITRNDDTLGNLLTEEVRRAATFASHAKHPQKEEITVTVSVRAETGESPLDALLHARDNRLEEIEQLAVSFVQQLPSFSLSLHERL